MIVVLGLKVKALTLQDDLPRHDKHLATAASAGEAFPSPPVWDMGTQGIIRDFPGSMLKFRYHTEPVSSGRFAGSYRLPSNAVLGR